ESPVCGPGQRYAARCSPATASHRQGPQGGKKQDTDQVLSPNLDRPDGRRGGQVEYEGLRAQGLRKASDNGQASAGLGKTQSQGRTLCRLVTRRQDPLFAIQTAQVAIKDPLDWSSGN